MQSHNRSHVPLGEDYDSNASASYIAFHEFRSTNKIILNDDTVNESEEIKLEKQE